MGAALCQYQGQGLHDVTLVDMASGFDVSDLLFCNLKEWEDILVEMHQSIIGSLKLRGFRIFGYSIDH